MQTIPLFDPGLGLSFYEFCQIVQGPYFWAN